MIPFPRKRDPEYLTAKQVADRWGLNVESVYRIPRDELPYIQVPPGSRNPRRRYPVDVIVDYEAQELSA